ncbi:hypothetical protein ACJJTC_011203 [Scirpophaga incertulas]
MTERDHNKKQMMEEIINRRNLGDKQFHSETSLQHLEMDEGIDELPLKDPGVLNKSLNGSNEYTERRRTVSQPGPVAGNFVTATAARAARRRPQRSVAYLDNNDQLPRVILVREDSTASTPVGDRASPISYVNGTVRNGDVKSLNGYRIFTSVNDPRGMGTINKRSVAMDAQSLRSLETQAPPPTSPEDNKKLTKKYLTLVISCIYATILVTAGIIVYISSPIIGSDIATYFSIVLCSIGMLYHIYILLDIGRFKRISLKNHRIKSEYDDKITEFYGKQEDEYNLGLPMNGDRMLENKLPVPQPILIPLKHDYCFSYGRHSGSFYLKLGAAGFALGHLIHSVLLIAMQIALMFDETIENNDCMIMSQVVLDVLFPCYSFLQLYFIFKYSNVIILKHQGLSYFGLMHIIGSSLCFWLSAISRETVLALTLYADTKYGNNNDEHSFRIFNISGLYDEKCAGSNSLTNISKNFSPYLFPFSVEFNILIVAVYYIMWSQVGQCKNEDNNIFETNSNSDENYTLCKIPTANEENDFTSNIVIYADCHASNRGLFLGLILIVIVAGMLIIGYVFSSVGEEYLEMGYLLNDYTMLSLHFALLLAVVIASNQVRKLDINEHPISLLDDVLLFICIPAFVLETILSLVATINIMNPVKITNYIIMTIQVLIQTPLIMDSLRRCSNSKKLRRTKPGREVLMFLIIANVGMWLFYTFSYKSPESLDERYTFYGKTLWSILGHLSLPLIMFYRFHSSVCFADIWDSAYKPGSEH